LIQEEIKKRLSSGKSYYHSDENLLYSHMLSRNAKIIIYKTIILPVVLYGRETWSLIVRKEHRLKMFENMVLERKFVFKRDEMTGG
jgi:dihydrofolate reductase